LIRVSVPGGHTFNFISSSTQLSNEFQFPIAAFHHASEAYLTADLLKNTFGKLPLADGICQAEQLAFTGGPPGVALFATNAR
jgi:hypothetical protein